MFEYIIFYCHKSLNGIKVWGVAQTLWDQTCDTPEPLIWKCMLSRNYFTWTKIFNYRFIAKYQVKREVLDYLITVAMIARLNGIRLQIVLLCVRLFSRVFAK